MFAGGREPLETKRRKVAVALGLPVIKVRGSPYERGVQHGRQCGDLIRRYPEVLLEALRLEAQWRAMDSRLPLPDREELLRRAMQFLPLMDALAPHLVEEVRGIADGARLSLAEVLLVNVRADVMGVAAVDALCTAFAVGRSATADGGVLSGQNLDQHPANRDLLIMLHVEPDSGPAMLICSFAGLLGYPGINSAGVSLFQNALSTHVWRASGAPHYFLKRLLLEQTSIAECLAVARRVEVCSSTNYVLTDRDGTLLDLEMTPDGLETLEPQDDLLVHTNHFRSAALASQEALLANIPDSARRGPRMQELLAQRHGKLNVQEVKKILADHDGAPTAICRHEPKVITIASMIAEPDQGRLHVAAGNPCEQDFVTYSL